MARYDRYPERRYDYGLRGYDDLSPRRMPRAAAERAAGWSDRRAAPRSSRVTARYNADYVFGGRGEENYPRNYNMFTGDRPDRIGDERYYRRPYTTIGGTRTFRGAPHPIGYDSDYEDYDVDFRRA